SLRRRPMARVAAPLTQMGAEIIAREGCRLPLCLKGTSTPQPIEYRLPVPSAQVKSAILLAGLTASGTTAVIEPEPTRDHTELMLRDFGAAISVTPGRDGERRVALTGRPQLTARPVAVPADPSSAAFPLVAALLRPGSSVTLQDVGLNPHRIGLIETLREMGAKIAIVRRREAAGEPVGDLAINARPLN